MPFQASENGEAIAYAGEPASTGGDGETGGGLGNEWLARRGSGGWKTEDVTPEGAEGSVYQAFTFFGGSASGYLEAGRKNLTSGPIASCRRLYSSASSSTFSPLFELPEPPPASCSPLFAGAASTGNHAVIFQAEGALTTDATEAEFPKERESHVGGDAPLTHTCMYSCNLYAAEGGKLVLVNKLAHKDVASANFGGFPLPGFGGAGQTDFSNAISRDGSRIYWTDTHENEDRIYMYSHGESVQVSTGPAQYWTATPDGEFAYYTENGGGVLKRFEAARNRSETLTEHVAAAGVQGVLGVNETGNDGEYLYVVATAVLATNENHEKASAIKGEPNLYVIHNGATRYIATLNTQDNNLEADSEAIVPTGGDWRADLGERTSELSADGKTFMFESINKLTSYNNTPEGGSPVPEVYVFNAAPETPSEEVVCASCNLSGESPSVEAEFSSDVPVSSEGTTYEHRSMSSDGTRVFFDSEQPLTGQVPASGTWNVFEWERKGKGSCTTATPPNGGCVYALSGGNGSTNAFFVEADGSGNNVFFVHRGGLGEISVPNARNELYDARVGGGFPVTTTGCAGSSCALTSSAASPELTTPPSTSLGGTNDNFTPTPAQPKKAESRTEKLRHALARCRHVRKRLRSQCIRSAEKRYGSATAARHGSRKKKGHR
jgi:hypothetical protein